MTDIEYNVTVCSRCKCASCWHGIHMCQKSSGAGTEDIPLSRLRAMSLENESYWSPEHLEKITGINPVKEDITLPNGTRSIFVTALIQ